MAFVNQFYSAIREDVINGVRDIFLDEGVDEQILIELKQTWEKKLMETKAIEVRENSEKTPNPSNKSGSNQTRGSNNNASHQRNRNPTMQTPSSNITGNGRGSNPNSSAHQLTPISNLVQPTLLQYTTREGADGQKTVTLVPQNVAITLPTQGIQLSSSAAAATLALAPELTATLLQQAIGQNQNAQRHPSNRIVQIDGANDTSDDDDEDDEFRDDDDHEDNDDEQNEDEIEDPGEEEEPLNSEDDVSDEDPSELFDTDNVVVCQYDKITRSRNKWKFHLKDGIMNLQGKDYVFQKAVGDAEW